MFKPAFSSGFKPLFRHPFGTSDLPDFFVDSVNGSDSNDGLTAETAFATLGKAETELADGKTLALARGSDWRDSLNVASLENVTVTTYGSGASPVIRATDGATGWTQPDAGTYPNVWYIANWTSELNNNNYRLAVYEDGAELPNVASLAALDSTAGSSFITTTPDGDDALYIHATGSGNPNTNGSSYEASKRISCIYTATTGDLGFTINGPVVGEKAPWASGAFVSTINTTIKRVNSRDGARGSFLTSGTVEDSVYSGGSTRTGSGTSNQLVFFTSSPAGTYPGTVRRCGFVAGDNPDKGTYEDISALFSHNDQTGVTHNCTTEQCWFVALAGMGGFRGDTHQHVAPYAKNAGSLNLESGTDPVAVPIRYGMFNGGVANANLSSWDAVHAFEHCVSYDAKMLRIGDGFDVQNCVWFKSGSQNALTQPISTGVPNLSVNNSIVITSAWFFAIDMSSLTSYTGNNNIFASFFSARQARFRYNGIDTSSAGTDQYKLKRWQDLTGQDANSVYVTVTDQSIGGANALFLGWAEASSGTLADHGPAKGDFRINPDARVYGGDDTAYIGTFPDGSSLVTNVGPQFHWDWNARSLSSGPPTTWPTVPESEADQATYVSDPAAWNFYP